MIPLTAEMPTESQGAAAPRPPREPALRRPKRPEPCGETNGRAGEGPDGALGAPGLYLQTSLRLETRGFLFPSYGPSLARRASY